MPELKAGSREIFDGNGGRTNETRKFSGNRVGGSRSYVFTLVTGGNYV
jgi:hypothetical protein